MWHTYLDTGGGVGDWGVAKVPQPGEKWERGRVGKKKGVEKGRREEKGEEK